jgi:hypothetical protein
VESMIKPGGMGRKEEREAKEGEEKMDQNA